MFLCLQFLFLPRSGSMDSSFRFVGSCSCLIDFRLFDYLPCQLIRLFGSDSCLFSSWLLVSLVPTHASVTSVPAQLGLSTVGDPLNCVLLSSFSPGSGFSSYWFPSCFWILLFQHKKSTLEFSGLHMWTCGMVSD